MSRAVVDLSVVIATKDRAQELARALDGLEGQELGGAQVEIVIVANGSSEDTLRQLRARAADAALPTQVLEHSGSPSAARNLGAMAATGELLLFLGDDTAPESRELLRSHIDLHAAHPQDSYGVLGRIGHEDPPSPFARWLDEAPRSGYWGLGTGQSEVAHFLFGSHLSLKRSLFELAGGFEECLGEAALEGAELAARLAPLGFELEYHSELLVLREHPVDLGECRERSLALGAIAAHGHSGSLLQAPGRSRLAALCATESLLGALARTPLPRAARELLWMALTQAAFARGYRSVAKQAARKPGDRATRDGALSLAAASLLILAALPAATAVAVAPEAPAWVITLTPLPANLPAGGQVEYLAVATNVGAKATEAASPSVVKVELPEGVTPTAAVATNTDRTPHPEPVCTMDVPTRTARCETTGTLNPGRILLTKVNAQVSASSGTLVAKASVLGGGGTNQAAATAPAPVQSGPVPFGFLPGFAAPANGADGSAAVLAGSHPYQMAVNFGFPTEVPGEGVMTNAGHPRDFTVVFPRGLIGNPAASPVLCTEAELTSEEGCPDASQVGTSDITTLVGEAGLNGLATSNLYNMVPPPGYPAELATNVAGVGIYTHVLASVRSGDDYRVQGAVRDVLNFGQQPIFNIGAQIWGDPSAAAHDHMRGLCFKTEGTCQVNPGKIPFLGTPGDCPGNPFAFKALADSWEAPTEVHATAYESTDLEGHPLQMEGCGELEFEPEVREALPSTDLTDSPAGLSFELFQPQEEPHPQPLEGRATAILKDATVTFPAGLAVNPSQAAGLDACSESQVGFEGEGEGALRFSEAPQSCPDAAKIGTLTASSPLLVQRDEGHEVELDPQTEAPLPEPLHGSLYLAAPFANPFGSLIAVYLVVEDEKTGITAKLAGEGSLDPATGQITTRVKASPEVPLEDFRVSVFGGDRGAFVTPPTCAGPYETQTDLTPWTAPEGQDAHPGASFEVTQAPDGGPCPSDASQMPNAPSVAAGTMEASAGRYSPLRFKLAREDGSQRFARLETVLPPGLTARLAGVAQCPAAGIERAISRERPQEGAAEIADPSCPAASEIGSADVAAGAGPHPFHTEGRLYLAGPYKDAPLSVVAITPAVAGPFDLGTVVVRAGVYLDPETARPRALTDPLPQLLDGVPADVRQVTLRLDRPKFTLNPTSCDEEGFAGALTSALGSIAPLAERFQVGGCKALPYAPKLSTRLFGPTNRGAHPRFRAVFSAKPGEANTAKISLALPHSEFIDQGHFRTICTRVQFAANQCPAGSVYGHVRALSPLVDYPLEGPIYLRSSNNKLPDAVAALHGPPSQPIEIDAVARVDSVNGGLRFTVGTVPDAPVTKVIITAQGAKKGLFQNSTNICRGEHRVTLRLTAQNAKTSDSRPLLQASCPKAKKKKKAHHHRS